jgi:hypothetical protein
MGDDAEPRRRHREPDHVADDIACDERRDALETVAQHPRDKRGDARPRRRHCDEIDGGEEDDGCWRHIDFLALRLAKAFNASTSDEKNIAA